MSGEINGKSAGEYLMFYKYYNEKDQHKSSAIYIGFVKFTWAVCMEKKEAL